MIFKPLPGNSKAARFDLTDKERAKPYSKYFDMPLAQPNPELIKILDRGPMDPSKALKPEDINMMLNPGYLEVETGYCIMPDGTGYVAVNNIFPGVTADMIKWWFAWHALEDQRYMLWYKPGHHGISINDASREVILDPSVPIEQKIFGHTHQVIENMGCGIEDVQINFLSPAEMGFDMSKFNAPSVATVIAANGSTQSREGGPTAPAVMMHFVRETPGGVEFRTRFWMGYQMVDGKPVKKLPGFIKVPIEAAKGLAYHNVEEFSNLAAFLPKLYAEMEGKIE